MANHLIRQEVFEARKAQSLIGNIQVIAPFQFKFITIGALLVTSCLVTFLIFGSYTRRETVSGVLLPSTALLTLSAQTTGTVTRNLVKEDEHVGATQPLVEVSANLTSASMGDTHALVSNQLRAQEVEVRNTLANLEPRVSAQTKDLRRRIGMLQTQVGQIDRQLTLQRQQVASSVSLVQIAKSLHERGTISTVEFDKYQSTALAQQVGLKALDRQRLDTEQQLSTLQAVLTQLPLDTSDKADQLRSQLAQLNAKLAKSEAARSTVLRAPCAGTVTTLLVKTGENVIIGEPLLSILPQDSKLEAQLLVPSSAIGFVEAGNRVVLHYQAYPYQKFGQQYGTVKQVSRSALSPAETASLAGRNVAVPLYRVQIALDRQTISAYGRAMPLKPGMALNAEILLDRRSLWQWVFEPLYGLRQQLATNEKKHPE